jgi:hypothetical protein
MFVSHLRRHRNQIRGWQAQIFCMRAVASNDSQNCARNAMTWITAATEITTTATSVDFSNDALSEQLIVISFFYDTDEFVTDRSREACISSRNLEVGITDTG